jgi:hypothetical protein
MLLPSSERLLATCFTLVSCVAYSSNLTIDATCSSETSVDFQRTARRYIPLVIIKLSSISISGHQMTGTLKTKLNFVAWVRGENYTDQATAVCQRSQCQPLRIEGATWSAWRINREIMSDKLRRLWKGVSVYYFKVLSLHVPCGGGLEYLHRSPASRKRRRKGNPVPGGISGPPCSWGI